MTKYYELYTKWAPNHASYLPAYSAWTAVAILIGSFTSNFFSIFLIKILGEENSMTIPWVCISRHIVDVIALGMIFLIHTNFYLSVSGFFVQ